MEFKVIQGAFNGLQFRRWHYRSIFIRLAVVGSQSREMKPARRESLLKIAPIRRAYNVVNRKPMYDFLVTNSNFGSICYRFRDIEA